MIKYKKISNLIYYNEIIISFVKYKILIIVLKYNFNY